MAKETDPVNNHRECPAALRLDTLNGKTVCLVWNEAFKAEIILPAIGQSLKDAHPYPYIKIIPYTEIDAATQAAGRDNPGRHARKTADDRLR